MSNAPSHWENAASPPLPPWLLLNFVNRVEAMALAHQAHHCAICQLSWVGPAESWQTHETGKTHRKRLLNPRAAPSSDDAQVRGPQWSRLSPPTGSRNPTQSSAIQFWPWPGDDSTFNKLAERFVTHLCQRSTAQVDDAAGDAVTETETPSGIPLAVLRAQKACEVQDQMRRCQQEPDDFDDIEALWGYAKEKFALRSAMAFNAITKFAPATLRAKLAGPLRVAAFGGGPAAEVFAAVVARDLADGTSARLAVYEWVETWRPIVEVVSKLIGEDIERVLCPGDVSKSLFDDANSHLQPADLQYDLLIFSHVLLECGRGDGEAPLQFLRDLWGCCDGTVLVLDAGQARGRGCRSRPLAGSLRQVQILASDIDAELVRINGASRTDGVFLCRGEPTRSESEKSSRAARLLHSAVGGELAPRVLCWKVITHWNLSSEAADPQFEVGVTEEDDEAEADDQETDEKIIRPKREKACLTYTLDEQYEDCLKICGLCYSLFHAVFSAPETRTQLFKDVKIEQPADMPVYTKPEWATAKTKIFDRFLEKVQKMLGEKYLHFLFGQVEIVRGSRLQRVYFLVPKAIRVLKNHSLVHKWQEECLVNVKRTSPEAQIDDFADLVNGEYISFVQKQFDLLGKPWPFNRAGEVIALCINSTMLTTAIINSILVFVYTSSYSEHSILEQDIHYPNQLSVYILTFFAGIHFSLSLLWLGFYVLSYSGWIIETKVDKWREENPQLQSQLNNLLYRLSLQAKFFCSDKQLLYTLFLLAFSFLGLFVSFLFNAVNTIDLCMRIPILAKVIESMTQSVEQVAGTMVLGFCIQYIAVGAGFLLFSQGYGFADKDTSACSTLMECLRAHFDYGFRSAPVWSGPKLTYTRFTFDYVYNLVIILIMAAIISGIIIDAFADLKEEQKSIEEKMKSSCFICSLSKSELERKRVKFENHILKEHYMWAYARFLLYLEETDPAELNGPESYVKQQIKENNTGFFPIARCIAMESSDAGEEHLEREVRVKDLDEFKEKINSLAEDTEIMVQTERGMKADMKELRDVVTQQSQKVQALNQLLASDEDGEKKKKKKTG
eukprot:s1697_g3.t2